MRIRGQLRLGPCNRRKSNTEERNSVERGAHRRKAVAPVRVCFAGAGERWRSCLPTSHRSPEDRVRIRAQLRLGSGNRRKMDTEEPNSVEKGAQRRKAPVPVRVCFAVAGARWRFCPPGRLRSTEDSILIRAQLRLTIASGRWRDRE